MRRLRVAGVGADVADRRVDVAVDRDEVEAAIQIEIGEGASESEGVARGGADAGSDSDVAERSLRGALVERQHFIIEVRYGEAVHAGVQEIGRVDSHTGAGAAVLAEGDSGLNADLFERPVAARSEERR